MTSLPVLVGVSVFIIAWAAPIAFLAALTIRAAREPDEDPLEVAYRQPAVEPRRTPGGWRA